MKTMTNIIYLAFALFAFACFALSPARAQRCNQACDPNKGNTYFGNFALQTDQGLRNSAFGDGALSRFVFPMGDDNTATGFHTLYGNTSGHNNNAYGAWALTSNTTGPYNNAFGYGALSANTTGDRNTAMGEGAMIASSTGSQNTAVGVSALRNNTTGFGNIAIGQDACNNNGSASYNTGVGWKALLSNNGSNNVSLGANAGKNLTTGSGNVCIGAGIFGLAGESNTTRIRNIYSSVVTARAVYIGSDNRIGTLSSSRRYKEEIKPMDKASETLFALKPVTFRYKKEVDAERALSFGLIAEDVAQISPDLITRDEKGNPQTVRYEAVNAMLLNEFLKEHRKNDEQGATIKQQQKEIDALKAELKEQASQIQKVSAQLELSKSAPQTVLNSQ